MSLNAIIGGVSPVSGTVLGGINDALRKEATRQDNAVTDAVGRGFGPGYSESFAKLAVSVIGITTAPGLRYIGGVCEAAHA